MSTDGMGLILEKPLEPCDEVLLKIGRFSHIPLAVIGRVARCDPSPGGGHFVGVQFVTPLTFAELARIS